MVPMDCWLLTVPVGLLLDIVGFLIIIRFGHSLFLRVASAAPESGTNENVLSLIPANVSDADLSRDQRRRIYARIGVALVITGFTSQIIGSVAAILL